MIPQRATSSGPDAPARTAASAVLALLLVVQPLAALGGLGRAACEGDGSRADCCCASPAPSVEVLEQSPGCCSAGVEEQGSVPVAREPGGCGCRWTPDQPGPRGLALAGVETTAADDGFGTWLERGGGPSATMPWSADGGREPPGRALQVGGERGVSPLVVGKRARTQRVCRLLVARGVIRALAQLSLALN